VRSRLGRQSAVVAGDEGCDLGEGLGSEGDRSDRDGAADRIDHSCNACGAEAAVELERRFPDAFRAMRGAGSGAFSATLHETGERPTPAPRRWSGSL
jgi:hypothetical protein